MNYQFIHYVSIFVYICIFYYIIFFLVIKRNDYQIIIIIEINVININYQIKK
jgi:hypothetical protein